MVKPRSGKSLFNGSLPVHCLIWALPKLYHFETAMREIQRFFGSLLMISGIFTLKTSL